MRSLFDQYDSPENRLTHALVCCLAEDPELLRDFVNWITNNKPLKLSKLCIVEQSLPGEEEFEEFEFEKRGLPDAWIHDDISWSLIIESKVSALVKRDQLHRHRRMAIRRGFETITLLVISVQIPDQKTLEGAVHRTWTDVYDWFFLRASRSFWAAKMVEYMEIAEERMSNSGYLKDGKLTRFSGIPFNSENPYSYTQAKRIIRLMADELRRDESLKRIGIDPESRGRSAIKGKKGDDVWERLSLKIARNARSKTQYHHLGISIRKADIVVVVTVPNGIKSKFSTNLKKLKESGFVAMLQEICRDLLVRLKKVDGAKPWIEVVQRRFRGRTNSVVDARVEVDLRTILDPESQAEDKPVKVQPEWVKAVYHAWTKKNGNIQISIGAVLPYTSKVVGTKDVLKSVVDTWLACEPLLKTLEGK